MREVERNIGLGLRNRDYNLSERMSYAGLIHDIDVLAGKVDNHDLGSKDESKDILNDRGVIPDIVAANTLKAGFDTGILNGGVYVGEFSGGGHHDSDEAGLHGNLVGNGKNVGAKVSFFAEGWLET